jgi:hypothetical protein
MGMAKKNGDRFYDFVDSEIQYLSQEQKRWKYTNTFNLAFFYGLATDARMIHALSGLGQQGYLGVTFRYITLHGGHHFLKCPHVNIFELQPPTSPFGIFGSVIS